MADISRELNNIKTAVYGEEVRGSIHDAIQKINNVNEESKPRQVALAVAKDYSSSTSVTYNVGDYVYYPATSASGGTHDGQLYICETPTTGGNWVSSAWKLVTISTEITDHVEYNHYRFDSSSSTILSGKSCNDLTKPGVWFVNKDSNTQMPLNDFPIDGPGWLRVTATNQNRLVQQVYPVSIYDYPFKLIRTKNSQQAWNEWMKIPIKNDDLDLFKNDLAIYVTNNINGTTSGLTFTYTAHGKMHISGTSTSSITKLLYSKSNGFPPSIGPGVAVVPYISSSKVKLNVCEYRNGTSGYVVLGSVTKDASTNYAPITFTESAIGARFELVIESGVTINEDVSIHIWVGNISDLISDFVTPATTSVEVEGTGLVFRNGVGERKVYELPNDEQTYEAVSNWLDSHPEATTSVEDYSLNSDIKFVRATLGYYTPEMFGYSSGDATNYVNQCISAINSDGITKTIRFRKGTYQLKNISLNNGDFEIVIDKNATLMPTSDATQIFDIGQNGSAVIHGSGIIDVNYISQYAISGIITSGKSLVIDGIEFTRIKEYGIIISSLGGNLTIRNCYVHDMRYKTSSAEAAIFCYVAAGQSGSKGNFIFDNNKLIETSYSNQDFLCGAGGVFLSNNNGDKSSAIITNNIFEGLGKSSDTITYSAYVRGAWDSVTINSNVFRNYYECAVSVRDSNNVEIVGNTFKDALEGYTYGREQQIGAINYQPSANATGSELRGLVVSGNAFKNAPYRVSDSVTTYASFITVRGKYANNALQGYTNDIIVTGNNFDGGKECIFFNGVNNFVFNDNLCKTVNVATLNSCKGIITISGNDICDVQNAVALSNCQGVITFSNNSVSVAVDSGYVLSFNTNSPGAIANINGNICYDKTSSSQRPLFQIVSVDTCSFTNNYVKTLNTLSTYLVRFTRVNSESQNIGHINVSGNSYDGSNISSRYFFGYIDSVEGDIEAPGSPINSVKPFGAGKCRYYDTTNNKFYISSGSTNADWKEISFVTPATP